jgi:hydroxymethylpyrimidine/phosphomethylpyrimidine kinase
MANAPSRSASEGSSDAPPYGFPGVQGQGSSTGALQRRGAGALPPKALTIAGIDPSGGAGVLADIKTFSALGAYGCGVVCALTAQNTQAVTGIHGTPPDFIRLQLSTLFADIAIDAAKIGMIGTAQAAQAVAEGLHKVIAAGELPHRVLDPVMVAKSGDQLLEDSAVGMLIEAVMPLATVITPNLPEVSILLRQRAPETLAEMRRAAERLRRLMSDSGERWVLVKGGHLEGDAVDLLHDGDRMIELPSPRVATRNSHGTGCTLSAAIAALLPQAVDVPTAVGHAKRYLTGALATADQLIIGRTAAGHGPVNHFYHWWRR